MIKGFIGIAASLCLVLCVSFAFAAEQVAPYDLDAVTTPAPASPYCFLQPSFSTGFSEAGAANYQFNFLASTGLAGVSSLNLRTPAFPGFYLAGDLPYAVNDRLKVTLGARWAPGYNSGTGQETYTQPFPFAEFGRGWASGDSDWVTADLLASYAFVKNCSCLKDFSIVAGFRYDYHNMGLSDPIFNPLVVNGKASDTIGLTTQTYEPVLGLTATLPGYKCGIFGGDIKLGVLGSPVVFGNVDYRETFGAVQPYALISVNGNLNAAQTEFFCISAEATAVSWKMCSGLQATVSIFADYTKFYGAGNLAGQVTVSGIPGPVETSAVGFAMDPSVLTAGLKFALAF
ncbi:MAG: hypothetical protein ACLP51_07875 [Syntrophobacteraceae bacterium]